MIDGGRAANWFSKPGDSLRLLMQRRSVSATDLANKFPGGMATVRGLLDGSLAIDALHADVLADQLGGTQAFWIKRQANYELALHRAIEAAVEEAQGWMERVPAQKANRLKTNSDGDRDELRRRMTFFNVSTLASWQERYGGYPTSTHFRTSASFKSLDAAALLWLRRGELESDLVATKTWNADNLRDRLDAIRKLSCISHPFRFLPKLRTLCAEAGLAVVVVKTPPDCYASGASRLVTSGKAMMLLSFRHRADDQFWFTVFHEIGHMLLHGARTFIDADDTPNDDFEQEANAFASSCIIPDHRQSEFAELHHNRDAIIRFSVSVGISPGLTVGQLQHRQKLAFNRLNTLKRRWTWEEIDPVLV